MYDQDAINDLHDKLEATLNHALYDQQDYELAARCARALDALQKWQAGGFGGPPPADAQEITGIPLAEAAGSAVAADQPAEAAVPQEPEPEVEMEMPEAARGRAAPPVAEAPEEPPEPAFSFDLDSSSASSREDDALTKQFDEGKKALESGRVDEAIAAFETVAERAHRDDLRSAARRYLAQARAIRQDKLNQAMDEARKHTRAQRRDLKGRRDRWEAVLELDPDNQVAQEELNRLEGEEIEQGIRSTVEALRRPLQVREKRISEVEQARNQALGLLQGGRLRDPDLIQEIQELYDSLNKLRNEIFRLTEKGTTAERSEKFEDAIAAYQEAYLAGVEEIIDYTTEAAEPIKPIDALRRTRLAYFAHLKERASQRYNDAKENLAAGSPEAAIKWLIEAQDLLSKVEEGGEEPRKDVQNLLDKARHENDLKQEAEALVLQAQDQSDPEKARELLTRAKQRYPTYPDIDALIKGKEALVLRKVVHEITQDLANARGALAARQFADARNLCNQALSRGLNLEASSQDLVDKRRDAEALLNEIGTQEKNLQDLLNKMAKIDQALDRNDVRLAKRLLDLLSDEERRTDEAGERLAQLGLASEDEDRFRQAQRAFQEQNFDVTVTLCKDFESSREYANKARELRSRAEARLAQQEIARLKRLGMDREEVKKKALAILALRGFLPTEDEFLLQDAEKEVQAITAQEAEEGKHEREIVAWKAMRSVSGGDPAQPLGNEQWHRWYDAYRALRKKLPEHLYGRLDQERDDGVKAWREEAFRLAEQAQWEAEDSYAAAYAVLEPLYKHNFVTTRDVFFKELAQQYHAREAEALAGSDVREDLDAAVEHRREALQVANPPYQKERRELAATIKTRALRLAMVASLNPGPGGALAVLKQQLEEHKSYLEEDPEVRQQIVRYAVDAGEFDTAARQTTALEYLPNQAAVARLWSQLADVASSLSAEGGTALAVRARAARDLVRIREEAIANAFTVLQEATQKRIDTLADRMSQATRGGAGHPSNEEVIERIRLYALILQLRPGDRDAKEGITAMKGRLGALSKSMVDDSKALRLGTLPFAERLRRGEEMLAEQQAVLDVFRTVGDERGNEAQDLKGEYDALSEQVQTWHASARQLEQLETEWRKAVRETWDVGALEDLLSRASQTTDAAILAHWEDKVSDLREHLTKLTEVLPRLEAAWAEEKFEQVLSACDETERRLNQARTDLKEKDLAIPDRKVSLYDSYLYAPVVGIGALRQATQAKVANQQDWEHWYKQFQEASTQGTGLANSAEAAFRRTPPCMTQAEAEFREAVARLEQTLRILGEIPSEVRCGVAKNINDRVPVARILGQCNHMIDQAGGRLAVIDSRKPELKNRIDRLEAFVDLKRPMHVPANRETLRKLVEAVEEIDSCHPRVRDFSKLIGQFEGKRQ